MPSSDQHLSQKEEDEDFSKEDLERTALQLKKWILTQEHLPPITDDTLLYHMAAVSKLNFEKACKRLDSYFTVRTLIPEFFSNRDPLDEEIQSISKLWSVAFMPGVTPDGCKIAVVKVLDPNPAAIDFLQFIRKLMMQIDFYLFHEVLKPGQGIYTIIILQQCSFGHATKFPPSLIRKVVFCLKDVYPIRIKGFIFTHIFDVLRIFINTAFVAILPSKLRSRIYMFGDKYEKLYNIIPREILPTELGGLGPSSLEISERSTENLIANREWFQHENLIRSDESKRKGKCPLSVPGCSIM